MCVIIYLIINRKGFQKMFYKKAKKYLALSLLLPIVSMSMCNTIVFAGNEHGESSDVIEDEIESSEVSSYNSSYGRQILKFQPIANIYRSLFDKLSWDKRAKAIPPVTNDTRPLREIFDEDNSKTQVVSSREVANIVIHELDQINIPSTLLVANVGGREHVAVMATIDDDTKMIVDLSIDIKTRDMEGTLLNLPVCYYLHEYICQLETCLKGKVDSLYLVDEDVRLSVNTFSSCKKELIYRNKEVFMREDRSNIPLRVMGEYMIPSGMHDEKSRKFSSLTGHDDSGKLRLDFREIEWKKFEEKYILPSGLEGKLEALFDENIDGYKRAFGELVTKLWNDGRKLNILDADRFMKMYFV